MKKSFGARRVARKIGADEDDDEAQSSSADGTAPSDTPTFVKRPANKSRKSSSLRTSVGASFNDLGDDDAEPSGVVTPRRSNNLSKVAVQRNAERKVAVDVPFRMSREGSEERPSYNKSMLDELRQSTPSTPANVSTTSDAEGAEGQRSMAVDVAAKFGNRAAAQYRTASAIPTDAEIREKKERRARLAREQDYISLDAASGDDDLDENVTRDESGRLILKPEQKYAETRLVRNDEDIFEDFDEFTTDGKVHLGRNAEKEAEKRRRAEMASMIADAEGQGDELEVDSDDSDAERNAAFEDTQTRSGTYASRAQDGAEPDRPRTPPRIAPLPSLSGVLSKLTARLEDMEMAQAAKVQELENLRKERVNIDSEEVRIQAALKETAEKFAHLREAARVAAGVSESTEVAIAAQENGQSQPRPPSPSTFNTGRGGLGLGFAGPGDSDEDSY